MSKTKINVVVAACNNMGIGINGKLPWRLKQDMAFFKKVTSTTSDPSKKNVVIMGKNTWLSIPAKFRPLSGRLNIVLSTTLTDVPQNVYVVKSLEQAMDLVNSMASTVENVFVIGGASVYKEAMFGSYPCRVYLTRVMGDFICDTFLPQIDETIFTRIPNPGDVPEGELEDNGTKYHFVVFEKKIDI
ncbi:dihydrofolate reductase [Plakobranchus ocellatus]|uniref:dihydrofolate reductase n=1 Tax=Plakobranchus ocellatus TaxID=259542 RepID=A0AAV3ZR66_9GAST|nr:dihydrofolate reductase [Plakobranchus ocellatus]